MRVKGAWALVLCVTAVACQRTTISDTGYTGTWARGEPRARSVVSIVHEGERVWFRLKRSTDSDKWKVTCGWDGACVEQIEGKTVATHTFRWWLDPASGHLVVEQRGVTERGAEIHNIDTFLVEPGGRRLAAHSTLRYGRPYTLERGPVVYFEKISDEVADRPSGR